MPSEWEDAISVTYHPDVLRIFFQDRELTLVRRDSKWFDGTREITGDQHLRWLNQRFPE